MKLGKVTGLMLTTMGIVLASSSVLALNAENAEVLMTVKSPLEQQPAAGEIVLKNDSFNDNGGQAYIQQGFVTGEKAGVWVQVPASISKFKIDSFRVLMGNVKMTPMEANPMNTTVFFTMGIASAGRTSAQMPVEIENAASVTPGPYWNDIPAVGEPGTIRCANGGEMIGAALEFTHTGLPSVYRDVDGLSDPTKNTLMAIPGGWNYSVSYGLRGDWVLRIVGHEAKAGECN